MSGPVHPHKARPLLIEFPDVSFVFQEPRHLQLLADLEDSNVFTITTGKKQHSAPTDYGFCIKVRFGPWKQGSLQ